MFVHGKTSPSLMFVIRAGAYPSEAPSRSTILGQAPGLTYKH